MKPTERIPVAFAAHDRGVGEMSWGQLDMWLAMVGQSDWLPQGGSRPIEPGTTVLDVEVELRYLMTRFPALRTRLRYDAPGGRPVQEVFGAGEIVLEVFDADGGGDTDADSDAGTDVDTNAAMDGSGAGPRETAAAVEARYRAAPFDFVEHWPVRMAVVRSGGVPAYLVAIVGHLALDSVGAQVMLREVAERPSTPPTGMQPLEQARWQRSAAGLRQNAAALRYWENLLRTVPARRAPNSPDPRRPRQWRAEFTSSALQLGAQAIAERVGAGSAEVMLAVHAVALARVTGVNPVVTRPLVSNRFHRGLADVMCTAVQGGILALDVAEATVDEAVRRAQRATMAAYKHAYYDPEQMQELVARITRDRGPAFDIGCFYNDRRVPPQAPSPSPPSAGAPVTPGELSDACAKSVFRWGGKDDNQSGVMFIHVDDAPEGVRLTIRADTGYFGPDDIEGLAWGMEAVAVEAAFDPSASTCVSAPVTFWK